MWRWQELQMNKDTWENQTLDSPIGALHHIGTDKCGLAINVNELLALKNKRKQQMKMGNIESLQRIRNWFWGFVRDYLLLNKTQKFLDKWPSVRIHELSLSGRGKRQ